MRKNRYIALLTIGLFLSFKMYSQQNNDNISTKDYEIGIGGGILLPGKINVSELNEKVKTKLSIGLKGYVDASIKPNLFAGVYVGFANIGIDDNNADNSVTTLEIGGALKPKFTLNEKISIKPGVEFGYRRFYSDLDVMDGSQGMVLNANCEFQYAYSPDFGLFGTVGFVTQPYGGKEHVTHLDFGPILFVMVGVVF